MVVLLLGRWGMVCVVLGGRMACGFWVHAGVFGVFVTASRAVWQFGFVFPRCICGARPVVSGFLACDRSDWFCLSGIVKGRWFVCRVGAMWVVWRWLCAWSAVVMRVFTGVLWVGSYR